MRTSDPNEFSNLALQILTWEINGHRLPGDSVSGLSRAQFWQDVYYERRTEDFDFKSFLRSQPDLMIISGNVGVGKSTYVRHKFESKQLCRGLIFDMFGKYGDLSKKETLLQDLQNMIRREYAAALRNNYKIQLLSNGRYADKTHEPDNIFREHPDWDKPNIEDSCRNRIAIQALTFLQSEDEIWRYVRNTFGIISAEGADDYGRRLVEKFDPNVHTLEVLDLLQWHHYVKLFHLLEEDSLVAHVMAFDNIDWLELGVIRNTFITCVQDIMRRLKDMGIVVKAIVTVRDENIAYFSYGAGASANMWQMHFSMEDYKMRNLSHYLTPELDQDFSKKVMENRLKTLKAYIKTKAEAKIEATAFFHIIERFWLLEGELRPELGRSFHLRAFCNESLRLMFELVHECTFAIIRRLSRKNLLPLAQGRELALPVVKSSLICSLAHNTKTSRIIEAFYDSVLEERRDNYCCIYRLILIVLSNQPEGDPFTFLDLCRVLGKIFPDRTENDIRNTIHRLYHYGAHHGELVVIYQSGLIQGPNDIEHESLLQITGRGRIFIESILINFDFFKGVMAREKQRRPVDIIYEMMPDKAFKFSLDMVVFVGNLADRHIDFVINTVYKNLKAYDQRGKDPFRAYEEEFTYRQRFHLERACENHKSVIKSYITECMRKPEECSLLLDASESEDIKKYVPTYLEEHGKKHFLDEELSPIINKLPKSNFLYKMWNEVYLGYNPILDKLLKVRALKWADI
jgi:hypothetical protein